MATLKCFRALDGRPGFFEHYQNEEDGRVVAVDDDVVYKGSRGRFTATRQVILCTTCGCRRSACHCAAPHLTTLQRALNLQQKMRGLA